MNLFTMFTIAMMVLLLAVLVYWYTGKAEGFQTASPAVVPSPMPAPDIIDKWFSFSSSPVVAGTLLPTLSETIADAPIYTKESLNALEPSAMTPTDKKKTYYELLRIFNAGPSRIGLTLTDVQKKLIRFRTDSPTLDEDLESYNPVQINMGLSDMSNKGTPYSYLWDALQACSKSGDSCKGVYYDFTEKRYYGVSGKFACGSVVPAQGSFLYLKKGVDTPAPCPGPAPVLAPPPAVTPTQVGEVTVNVGEIGDYMSESAKKVLEEYEKLNRQQYVESGKAHFNRLADTLRPFNSMFATEMSGDGTSLDVLNKSIQDALKTIDLSPVDNNLVGSPPTPAVRSNTYAVSMSSTQERLPKNTLLRNATEKCQTKLTSSCTTKQCTAEEYMKLSTDMCDKIGSNDFPLCGVCLQEKSNTTIGAIGNWFTGLFATSDNAVVGGPATPSVGSCTDGLFFTDKDACKQKVNQLLCEKFGESNPEKCAYCMQSGKYVYQAPISANESPSIRVRMLFPAGTGTNSYTILKNGTAIKSGTVDMAGSKYDVEEQITYTLSDTLTFSFTQEFPHRPSGLGGEKNKEVFLVDLPAEKDSSTFPESIGCEVATRDQIQNEFYNAGGDPGVDESTLTNTVWCWGLKPWTQAVSLSAGVTIYPFKIASTGIPERYSRWSTLGANIPFRVPSFRGVLVQCERASVQTQNDRRVGTELFMTQVGGLNITDANRSTLYKRQGTFEGSQKIQTPKQKDLSGAILSDQYWIWSTDDDAATFSFTMEAPFLLQDPTYQSDLPTCPSGPLLKVKRGALPDACGGQGPGNYTVDCLTDVFIRAGGTSKGTFYPSAVNRSSLLGDKRTLDDIRTLFENLYSIATKAVDLTDNRIVDKNIINDAAMKMFGLTLLGPCDKITRDAGGAFSIQKSMGPFSAECLDYIYRNAPNDASTNFDSSLPYKNISDRYSGLTKTEGTQSLRDTYPFRTCQANGDVAPFMPDGKTIKDAAVNRVNYKSDGTPRTYQEVVTFYNSIYQAANAKSTSTNPMDIQAQQKAIADCYGIQKKEYVTDCRGVTGAYIRLLPSAQRYGLPTTASGCDQYPAAIQLAKIAVFDAENKEIPPKAYAAAFRDPTVTNISTNYCDISGAKYSAAAANTSYWQADLSGVQNVSRVIYTGMSTCSERAQGMVVQLLDADKKVVLQKTLAGTFTDKPEILLFLPDDLRPPIPFAVTSGSQGTGLIAGIRVRIESAVQAGMFIGRDTLIVQNPQTIANTRLKLRPISDRETTALQLSVGSVTGAFKLKLGANDALWMHGMDCRLAAKPTAGTEGASLYENWSDWILKPAINGAYAFANIESATNPGWYLVPTRVSVGTTGVPQYQVDILNITRDSTDLDLFRICWKIYPA